MHELLTLSRAARLVGVSRGELQKRIRDNELNTFEGKVSVSDVLRAFPEARLEDDSALERVRRIKAAAAPRRDQEIGLPRPEVLASRLTCVSRELTEAKAELGNYSELVNAVSEKLAGLEELDEAELRSAVRSLTSWLDELLRSRPRVPRRTAELLARDTFLRMIAAQIKLIPSGHEFFVDGTDSILEAGLRHGLALRYGCTSGTCGSCKARVVSGDVLKVREHEYEMSVTEQHLGYVLMCSYTAVTDLTLEAAEAHDGADIPLQQIPARVKQLTPATNELAILHVQTPITQRLRFLAGQSATLALEQGAAARLPIASCPCDGRNLEFHVRREAGSSFSEAVFSGAVQADGPVFVTGPEGNIVLAEDAVDPTLFLAYDVGFATIKSLVETAVATDNAESYHLCWAVPREDGFYMDNRCRAWADALDNFTYTRLVLDLDAEPARAARALAEGVDRLEEQARCQVYAAGPASFLEAVRLWLDEARVQEERRHLLPVT